MTATQHFAAIRVIAAPGAAEASIVITDEGGGRKRITINQTGRAEATATTASLTTLAAVAAFIEANTDNITATVMPIYGEQHNPGTLAIASYQLAATRRYALLAGAKPAPVIEAIAEVIDARLHTIDSSALTAMGVLDESGLTIRRPRRTDDFTIANGLILLTQWESPEPDPDNSAEGNPPLVAERQGFHIALHSVMSDAALIPIDTAINLIHAEVNRAIANFDPTSAWHRFDGLALRAEWSAPQNLPDEMSSIRVLTLDVLYRTQDANLYIAS